MSLPEGRKTARQRLIISELALSPTVRTSTLAQRFGVSIETIRRDIEELTRRGIVDRTYGGASGRQLGTQPNFSDRDVEAIPERDQIARIAASLVTRGAVVMIDTGSTTARLAQVLAARDEPMTVITNGLPIASAFLRTDRVRVVVCPGELSPREQGVYGSETCGFVQRFYADIAFIGASGLTTEGPTDVEMEACWVKRAMLERSERRVLLIDSTKFGRRHLEVVCPLSSLSDIITDQGPEKEIADRLAATNVVLHTEEPGYGDGGWNYKLPSQNADLNRE
ncbi:DeoR/GlpR family DNA-binding transcription regulator [Microvirga rosea]|uniref:DeoR/GlpR family DNA-binding transcription regulator n=1 Tax=Microvirga rosea TaxID=2715425 RepID=UPI001D0A3E51|nr:DeoR/GlpR family DNA-binding transcription regulator [Microvirga rosea]MCB8823027.1 DeoR/GlpR family DNA-binding transcription regulator [Microvirga rosea]